MLEKIPNIPKIRNNCKSLCTVSHAAVWAEANRITECYYKIEFGGSHVLKFMWKLPAKIHIMKNVL